MSINEMYNSNNSPELNKKLKKTETPNKESKINFLRECWVNEDYLKMFADVSCETTERLISILWSNPSQEEIWVVNASLDTEFKTPKKIYGWLNFFEYNIDRTRWEVHKAANDENYWLTA